jgi:SSS family solute:Na+ symporter
MAIGLGIFATLVILPTMFMGMYGAVLYPDSSVQEFIGHVLLYDQAPAVAALGLIGLIAAAISTSDSQIFALGTELRSLLTVDDKRALAITRIFILVFGVIALVFSILSSEQLVLLARTSFAGTAMLGPLILVGILSEKRPGLLIPVCTLIALLVFVLSSAGVIPGRFGPVEIEMLLFVFLLLATGIELVRLRSHST